MINLLPPDLKETYRYGKRNRVLAHWVIIIVFCWAGGIALTMGGFLYMNHAIANTNQQLSDSKKQLHAMNDTAVQKQVKTISGNLKLATQVLSKEVLFSDLLKQMGAVTPSNAVLTNLTITQAQGGIDLSASTTNYAAATQLQANLADPKNRIFSSADIESINCSTSTGTPTQYPCSVTIRALFAKDNPYLFINAGKKGGS